MESLFEISNKLLSATSLKFLRSLYDVVNWDARLLEIRGARGVGKTTLIKQKAKELRDAGKNVLYISLDNPFFYNHSLIEAAEYHEKYGGDYLFIDEVHKYPSKQKGYDWSAEVKYIYDHHPELKVIYTGSSVIQLYKGKGDLSRRKSSYYLPGLSFREYLEFNDFFSHPVTDVNAVLKNHESIAGGISEKIKILPHFDEYIRNGYYPFYNEDAQNYYQRLAEVISLIIETDIPSVMDTNYDTTVKVKKLLSAIASSVPFTPNIHNLRKELYISDHRTILKYLAYLEKADVISTVSRPVKGTAMMRKPDKVYLNNTNMAFSLLDHEPEKGNLRETFFLNQLRVKNKIDFTDKGDFLVDKRFVFEIGGKNKTNKQVRDIDHSYVVMDGIETGHAKKIPLWLFGFLY